MNPSSQFGDAGPQRHARPVAVVDIGSNSVRLVIYEGGRRAPATLFNEKETCGLGKAIALTGRLDSEAVEATLSTLTRFRILTRQMGVGACESVATAAVREASNGEAFLRRAEACLGAGIRVLSGEEEARLAAFGVRFGCPRADGLVGDLGGGSLELADLRAGMVDVAETAPLGALRLSVSGLDMKSLTSSIDRSLSEMECPPRGRGRSLYAVGGTWRTLAKLHMETTDYPLRVIEGYTIDGDQALSLARDVRRAPLERLKAFESVSASRLKTLPYGALLLERLLRKAQPSRLVFSAHGLRDGVLSSHLPARIVRQDPLLSACTEFGGLRSRSIKHIKELTAWMEPVFRAGGETESPFERRLREAACLLSDVAWRVNPDYRANRALELIAIGSFAGVDHAGRAFVALSVFHRHEHRLVDPRAVALAGLCDARAQLRARRTGAAIRLGSALTGESPGILPRTRLEYGCGKVTLTLPADLAPLAGGRVGRRLGHLAQTLGAASEIVVAD